MRISAPDFFALTVALALHAILLALLWFGLPPTEIKKAPAFVPVQAVFLDESRSILRQQRAEEARLRVIEEAARQAAEEAARRKAAEEAARKLAAEQAARKAAEEAARKKAAEEAARKAAEEAARKKAAAEEAARKAAEEAARKKAAAEEAARKAAEEAARKKAEQEAERKRRQALTEKMLKEALAAEEAALAAQQKAAEQASQDASDRAEYQRQLFRHIQRNWTRPAGAQEDFSCRIRIQQLPGGQIQSYELLDSCGNPFLDASVENALRKSDPLPLPANPRVFDRTLTLQFEP